MANRRQWITTLENGITVGVLTLYGDQDEDTRAALMTMISEATALANVVTPGMGIRLEQRFVNL